MWLFSLHATQYSQGVVALCWGVERKALSRFPVADWEFFVYFSSNLYTARFHQLVIAAGFNDVIIATPPFHFP